MNSKRSSLQLFVTRHGGAIRWASILCLLLIVHLTHNRISAGIAALTHQYPNLFGENVGQILVEVAPAIKALLFVISLIALTQETFGEVFRILKSSPPKRLISAVLLALIVTTILGVLVIPNGTISMGEGYAARSMQPFEQDSDWYHKRLLMPAIAYLMFFRGDVPYLVFGFLITIVFVALLHAWLRGEAPMSFLGLTSLCTSSFVIYQFQAPGYPDILVFCFLLGVMFATLSDDSKFVFLVLALLTHEASLFIGLPLAWRYLDRRHRLSYFAVVGLYGFLWLAASRFRLASLLGSHDVEGLSGLQWVIQNPWLEIAGIFFAFKALWLLPVIAIPLALKGGRRADMTFIIASVAATFALTTVGVDCSRMAGYGFPAILVALQIIIAAPRPPWAERTFSGLFAFNLLIPSCSVGLNVGVGTRPGLYGTFWRFITMR